MKDFIVKLLSTSQDLSTTRFVQVTGLIMAFIIAIVGMKLNVDLYGLSLLCLSFIVPQTIAKVLQKRIEVSSPK